MGNILYKLWEKKWMLRSILSTFYFNFHYLPLRQAIKLPILLYKPHLHKTRGKVVIEGSVRFGMIQLGTFSANINPNDGISYENLGGTIVFKGSCSIGNHSFLSVGSKGCLTFGECFINASGLKCVCFKSITFGKHVRTGWNTMLIDTNFHPMVNSKDNTKKRASGAIEIGEYNWFGTECLVMHSVHTPARCTFGARTTITRSTEMESYAVTVPSSRGIVVARGTYRDIDGPNDMDESVL